MLDKQSRLTTLPCIENGVTTTRAFVMLTEDEFDKLASLFGTSEQVIKQEATAADLAAAVEQVKGK